jgi:hypothetical protein
MSTRHRADTPARSRVGALLFTVATACGLWFGATAPEVSPVTPPPVPDIAQGPVPATGNPP